MIHILKPVGSKYSDWISKGRTKIELPFLLFPYEDKFLINNERKL